MSAFMAKSKGNFTISLSLTYNYIIKLFSSRGKKCLYLQTFSFYIELCRYYPKISDQSIGYLIKKISIFIKDKKAGKNPIGEHIFIYP